MMRLQKKSVLVSAVLIGIAMVFILFGSWGIVTTVQAARDTIRVKFTDNSPIQYTDLSGNPIGEGVHLGELRCVGDNCTQKIEFIPLVSQPATEFVEYEYKFKSRQVFDPEGERVIVSGTGIISSGGPKIKFSFNAVFQNNGDGTIQVTYIASIPGASFIFPAAPGTFSISSNN